MRLSALSGLVVVLLAASDLPAETVCRCPNSKTTCTCETVQAASCVVRENVCHTSCKTVPASARAEAEGSLAWWYVKSFRGKNAKAESLSSPANRKLFKLFGHATKVDRNTYFLFDEGSHTSAHIALPPEAKAQLDDAVKQFGNSGLSPGK